jgi:hypothetical protein
MAFVAWKPTCVYTLLSCSTSSFAFPQTHRVRSSPQRLRDLQATVGTEEAKPSCLVVPDC